MQHQPPRLADKFLQWYCKPELIEEIRGDLQELYDMRHNRSGKLRAGVAFVWDVIRLFHHDNIKRAEGTAGSWRFSLLIAWRETRSNKLNTSIKLLTIALSFGYALTLLLMSLDEYSYDTQWKATGRIYRIGTRVTLAGNTTDYAVSPLPLARAFRDRVPEVERTVRMMMDEHPLLQSNGEYFNDVKAVTADSNLFRVMTPVFLEGDIHALDQPHAIVLTKSLATRIFGDSSAIGRSLRYNKNTVVDVTAVIADPLHHSHLDVDAFISEMTFNFGEDWMNLNAYTYIVFRPNTKPRQVEARFHKIFADLDQSAADGYKAKVDPIFEEITSLHLSGPKDEDIAVKGPPSYPVFLLGVALLFALLGIANYVNLSAAELTQDSKKVGLLTLFGGSTSAYRRTHLLGSFATLCAALGIAVLVIESNLILVEHFLGKHIDPTMWHSPAFIWSASGLFTCTLVCISLNAFWCLRESNLATALRSKIPVGKFGINLRQAWVGIQFSFSIVMIALILILVKQFDYVQAHDKGFKAENVIVVKVQPSSQRLVPGFRTALTGQSGIVSAARSSFFPGVVESKYLFATDDVTGMKKRIVAVIFCTADYLSTIGSPIVNGRTLRPDLDEDKGNYLINESAAREFGWNDPIGKRIAGPLGAGEMPDESGHVVGVVRDFNYASLYSKIDPLIIVLNENHGNFVYIKMEGTDVLSLVHKVEAAYKTAIPDFPFEWEFLDAKYNSLYQQDRNAQVVFRVGMIISIVVALLGIFSLSALLAGVRQRQACIRKIVGASPLALFWLHLKDFLKLLIIASAIAWPLIVFLSNIWLGEFAYRIDVGTVYYVLPTMLAGAIILLTAGYHGLRIAGINPASVLKHE